MFERLLVSDNARLRPPWRPELSSAIGQHPSLLASHVVSAHSAPLQSHSVAAPLIARTTNAVWVQTVSDTLGSARSPPKLLVRAGV